MIKGHARSAMTMNFVRALIDGGFADLHHPEYWDLDWVRYSPLTASTSAKLIPAASTFSRTWPGVTCGTG